MKPDVSKRGKQMFAQVIVENKSNYIDDFFTYSTGELDVKTGSKVTVPFGNKEKDGYVFGVSDTADIDEDKIREIISVDPMSSLTDEMISTAVWMKARYAIRYYDAVRLFSAPLKPRKRGTPKDPYEGLTTDYVIPENLTDEQTAAVKRLHEALNRGSESFFLIHGVTSSGKTEVYMKAIEEALAQGRGSIMLVPEISLTHQLIKRFIGRFGKENVAVLHSRLTPRERSDEWMRIRKGEARIVIGARMGVFAPLDNIGCIILDEEHEATYKADMTPKYDTHEVAAKRVMAHKGVMILGSATPSVNSYERAREGIYELIELKNRYNRTPLPKMITVDMRDELRAGNRSIFSRELMRSMEDSLDDGKQIILLQNRRGYSNFISCRECGKVMKCPECGISLTYHKKGEAMVCHYCGRKYPVPKVCPECGSRFIRFFGIGTEQVEEQVRKTFPEKSVDRLDIDSVRDRKELDNILERFESGETDILVGTQLVAKGLDFDNVGVVGVIAADTTLNIPDYRSEERTFQLVTQVAGRAGRGDEIGKVIIQTYEPDNYALTSAVNNDYEGFFDQETKIRSFLEYPPFGDMIMVNFTSDDEQEIESVVRDAMNFFKKTFEADGTHRIMDPKDAVNFKGKDAFRRYILLKAPKGKRNEYVHYADQFRKSLFSRKTGVNITIDVNPYSII